MATPKSEQSSGEAYADPPVEQRLAASVDVQAASAELSATLEGLFATARERLRAADAETDPLLGIFDDLLPELHLAVFAHPAHSGPAHAAGAQVFDEKVRELAVILGLGDDAIAAVNFHEIEVRAQALAKTGRADAEDDEGR